MRTFDVPKFATPGDVEVAPSDVCEQLRRVATRLDLLWRESLESSAAAQMAMRLGESSHGVHRALIALEP